MIIMGWNGHPNLVTCDNPRSCCGDVKNDHHPPTRDTSVQIVCFRGLGIVDSHLGTRHTAAVGSQLGLISMHSAKIGQDRFFFKEGSQTLQLGILSGYLT